MLQCHLQLLSLTWTSSVFETCRHEIVKATFRLISSLTSHLCEIIDSRLLMCEWQYTKRDPNMTYLSQIFARAPIAWFATTHLHLRRGHISDFGWPTTVWWGNIWMIVNHYVMYPFMVFPGDGWIIQYVPKYIDASWPNPIPCCLPHESKKQQ